MQYQSPIKYRLPSVKQVIQPSRNKQQTIPKIDKKIKNLTDADVPSVQKDYEKLEKILQNKKYEPIMEKFNKGCTSDGNCKCKICFKKEYQNIKDIQVKTIEVDDNQKRINFYDQEPIELYVAIRNLTNLDGDFSKSSPFVCLQVYNEDKEQWESEGQWEGEEYGENKEERKTEIKRKNLNPNFKKNFLIIYQKNQEQKLKFIVKDSGNNNAVIGEMNCTLKNIIEDDEDQQVIFDILGSDGQIHGKMIVKSEEPNAQNEKQIKFLQEHLKTTYNADESHFCFVVKYLKQTPKIKHGLNLNIPDTLFFLQGKPGFYVYTSRKEKQLIFKFFQNGNVKLLHIQKSMFVNKQEYEMQKAEKKNKIQMDTKKDMNGQNNLQGWNEQNNEYKNYSELSSIKQQLLNSQSNQKSMNKAKKKQYFLPKYQCKKCKQDYEFSKDSCKFLCPDPCRQFYLDEVDTTCLCNRQGESCPLASLCNKPEDMQDCVIIKNQKIISESEKEHPMSIMKPNINKQKIIRIELRIKDIKNPQQCGLGIVFINEKEEDNLYYNQIKFENFFFKNQDKKNKIGYFMFLNGELNPILAEKLNSKFTASQQAIKNTKFNQPYESPKKNKIAMHIQRNDIIEFTIDPVNNKLEFKNQRTEEFIERPDIIIPKGHKIHPCVILGEVGDKIEYIEAREMTDISMVTFKKVENISIYNEYQFLQIMQKGSSSKFWSEVQYIQNFLGREISNRKINENSQFKQEIIKQDFKYDLEFYDPLFERAKNDIKIINQDICKASSEYVEREVEFSYEENLMKQESQKYMRQEVKGQQKIKKNAQSIKQECDQELSQYEKALGNKVHTANQFVIDKQAENLLKIFEKKENINHEHYFAQEMEQNQNTNYNKNNNDMSNSFINCNGIQNQKMLYKGGNTQIIQRMSSQNKIKQIDAQRVNNVFYSQSKKQSLPGILYE
ncbi:C2 domain [Pseudocohnilembus persalinus]|uniref:C2 domain n=1 Tax=Pseudocohnilembus persalinus TaxID=266149 RepID=A0A0V0QI05_PSEPJ|nr:C2 domain [Pseudocohnilembus persalinus]|eukprot:KRX01680.1 C2 domain [Pseudocohnilembus persalinus]